ncbi:hypothetical protein [Cupriavidus basilensis]|nr:hypothetical protein [Cupriavidus basilensis]
METVKTLKLRIKDKHAKAMLAMARDVNTVGISAMKPSIAA